jgi:hypothetical protein
MAIPEASDPWYGSPARTAYLPSCGLIAQHLVISCALDKQFLVLSEMMKPTNLNCMKYPRLRAE